MRQRLILAASACALLVTALPAVAQDYNNPQQSPPQSQYPVGRAANDAGPNYSGTSQNTPPRGERTGMVEQRPAANEPNGFVQDRDDTYAQGGYRGENDRGGYGGNYDYAPGGYVGVSAPGSDAIAWCQAHFRSFDPATGSYMGFDGMRHSCP